MNPIVNNNEIEDPNVVKVIVNKKYQALYFSRYPIPYNRNIENSPKRFKHRGVYAFRKDALILFSQHEVTPLEESEKIECIRFLEMGQRIQMIETTIEGIGIDTPKDLKKARKISYKKN